jgi:anthranilate phosphoribosyltransferase
MPDVPGKPVPHGGVFQQTTMVFMATDRSYPELLATVLGGTDLSVSDATSFMARVMAGELTDAQIAAFLVALRAKGETVDEVVGFRAAILDNAVALDIPATVLDIVGTGGDPYGAVVNVSSIASIVAAAAGVPVVKHGNRAASSSSGASDLLGELGVNLELNPEQVKSVFDRVGLTFVFAAKFHPGFRHAATARKEIGVPTVFNILGPLCNPVRPEASAVGVSSLERVPQMASVFRTRGATALLYRGDDGIDKMTTTGYSRVWEVNRGDVIEHVIDVEELGLPKASIDDLLGKDAAHNAQLARSVLAGESGPVRDIVLLNTAAGITAYELSQDHSQQDIALKERLVSNIARASAVIDSGEAKAKLDAWVEASHSV